MITAKHRTQTAFRRDDGRDLEVVPGYHDWMLSYRRRITPGDDWTDSDYTEAVEKKRRRLGRLLTRFSEWGGQLEEARVLDVGCGDASNCLLLGFERVRETVGIDLHLPLFAPGKKGERTRALVGRVLRTEQARRWLQPSAATSAQHAQSNPPAPEASERAIGEFLSKLPVRLVEMDATRLAFPDDSFDWLISRSAMEHIRPVERALAEMARVVRPGGLIYLSIDPFYWVRGCHKRGLVDIPFAHARLTPEELRRFVRGSEGDDVAAKRCLRLETLNRFTLRQWRKLIEARPWDVLDWQEERSEIGEQILQQHPDILETLSPGVETQDLLHERVRIWLRKWS